MRSVQGLNEIPLAMVRALRPSVPTLVDRITTRIHCEVAVVAGGAGVDLREPVAFAVQSAVDLFLDLLEGRPTSGQQVDALFRRMGRAKGMDRRGLDTVRAACQIASHDAWQQLRSSVDCDGWPAGALGPLGDTLFEYLQHLVDQVTCGYAEAQRERGPERVRGRVLQAMFAGRPAEEIRALAGCAGWDVPDECVVLAADLSTVSPRAVDMAPHVLFNVVDGLVVVAVVPDRVDEAFSALARMPLTSPVARSWPVAVADVRHAFRWVRRALALVASGLIERTALIDCNEYRTELWLHADPALQRESCDVLLAPLLAEKKHQRAVLAETMLEWLRSHDSARVLAKRIGVHEQTVRRRLKWLTREFAAVLADPSQTVVLLMALESVAPAWLKEAPTANKRRASKAKGDAL